MGTLGRVSLQDGNFVLPNEEVKDHEQQPQFLPRITWPTVMDATHSLDRTALDTNIDWGNQHDVAQLHEDTEHIYPTLTPMPPYLAGHYMYDDCPWITHAAIAHNMFHRTLPNGKNLNAQEMTALIRIVTYGLFHSTTYLDPWVVHGVPTARATRLNPDIFEEFWSLTWCTQWKTGRFGDDVHSQDTDWIKRRLWTRRWVIVPIVYGGFQWGVTVFDRFKGQLFIFDCGDEALKTERVKSALHLWVDFLNKMGQPYHFTYFVPQVTKQLHHKDSGLLCAIWLMETLRNQTGRPMDSQTEGVERVDISICDYRGRWHPGDQEEQVTSSLCMRDWVPEGCSTAKSKLMAARRILRVMLANELGLRNHDVMTKQYKNQTSRGPSVLPSAFKLLQNAGEELFNTNSTMAKERFFTGHGGPQFALPMRRPILPYDADAPRRHAINKLPGDRHRTFTTPIELTKRSSLPFDWPEGFSFSARQPVSNPEPDLDLVVDCISDVPGLDTDGSRTFHVHLLNLAVAGMYQHLDQRIRFVIERVHARRSFPGDDGLFVVFTLSVAIGNGVRKSVDISMPLPRIPGLDESATPSTKRLSPA